MVFPCERLVAVGRVLLTPSVQRPEMLLNILQCTRECPCPPSPHTTKNFSTPNVNSVDVKKVQVQNCCLRTSLRSKTTPETEVVCSFVPQQHRMHSASWVLTIFLLTFCMGWADFTFLSSLSIREPTHIDAIMPVYMEA